MGLALVILIPDEELSLVTCGECLQGPWETRGLAREAHGPHRGAFTNLLRSLGSIRSVLGGHCPPLRYFAIHSFIRPRPAWKFSSPLA